MGVSGAIARRAEDAFNTLSRPAQKALTEVFTSLVEVDPGQGVPTRKRVSLNQFNESSDAQKFIETFTRERLLVSGGDGDQALLEVAHEALLRNWPRLADWIEERFDDFRLLRQVRQETAEWDHRGQDEAHLWRHERLQPVYAMIERLQPKLSDIEQAFIELEAEKLLTEIELPETTHQRRAVIGDRLAEIGDPEGRESVSEKTDYPIWSGYR